MVDEKDFRLIEYEQLRGAITYNIAQRRRVEELCVAFVAIIYAWLLSREEPTSLVLLRVALIFPGVVVFFGALRWLGIQLMISTIAKRMRVIESQIGFNHIGWEIFVFQHRLDHPYVGRFESWTEAFLWAMLGAFCFFACYYFWGGV